MEPYNQDEAIIAWVKRNWDIDDDVVERALGDNDNPRYAWIRWLPNGFWLNWVNYSIRERAFMVSVGHHMWFKLDEAEKDLRKVQSRVRELARKGK